MFIGKWCFSFLKCKHISYQVRTMFWLLQFPRTWITFNRFSTIFETFVPNLYLLCTHCIVSESLRRGCSSSTQNLMQISCTTCPVIWIQWPHSTHAHLMASSSPLTNTVRSSLFTHAHFSPLSLAARLCTDPHLYPGLWTSKKLAIHLILYPHPLFCVIFSSLSGKGKKSSLLSRIPTLGFRVKPDERKRDEQL